MPTYEYVCRACEHEFEEFQSMTAAVLKKCPECGKNQLERKIGLGAGVIFKGGGFYETDYRSESYKKAAQADSGTGKPAADNSSGAHQHNGMCGCGKKPADQCGSSAAKPASDAKTPSKSKSVKKASSSEA